jgi:hypothetical protein
MLGSTGYRHVVAEWLLQPRAALPVPPSNRGPWPSRRTEVADGLGGCVVVVTRVLPAERTWETTISPGDSADPDGPEAVVFARCVDRNEGDAAHEQAITLAADALHSTVRRAE